MGYLPIMKQSKEDLIINGARHRGAQLVTQAGYTLGLADAEGQALAGILEPGEIDAVRVASTAVELASGDRANLESEAREATATQNAVPYSHDAARLFDALSTIVE